VGDVTLVEDDEQAATEISDAMAAAPTRPRRETRPGPIVSGVPPPGRPRVRLRSKLERTRIAR
ncbi:MAG TPA: hypothetical protein VM820_12290, partial [Vicinamibacterales bacterium]|nr:hypothetical protein [Vicinamibacterales bacterium]